MTVIGNLEILCNLHKPWRAGGGNPVVAPNGIPTVPVDRLSSNTNGVMATLTVIPRIFRLQLLFFQFLKKRPYDRDRLGWC